ncbi:bifunctional diaminohydroxyphosphoribosylaminopyrimidine deaminase/5-amino-6-(5-phosphoribosylamino)uracil reductase RibD [Candidatus Micrarchaeota archaeon]|nr:bifunctional diaminohydroxyphosphoribosylaminopyrimidine deaminase/5-amino-6-(5-phosphoribosylamino)uracil reductase RibD [Candidatus Micrarchaeota archaeon]
MQKALELAQSVAHVRTAPNPRVGCILVKRGRVIAQAAHQRFGGPHAEAIALEKAGNKAEGATAYLTLEPCCHSDKKTPPCVQALIGAGIARAVIACKDKNPRVNGRGIRMLRKAGIAVTQGILRAKAQELNRFFFHWVRTGRPFVTLKMAASLDGRITSAHRWLSNQQALRFVQQLRKESDAILVGKDTVRNDDPRLTVRNNKKPAALQPLRVVLDSRLSLADRMPRMRLSRNGPLLLACTPAAPMTNREKMRKAGIDVWTAPDADARGHVPLDGLLDELGRRGIVNLLVEGGGKTATTFLEQEFVDEAWFVMAPLLSGPQAALLYSGKEKRFKHAQVRALGDDALFHVRMLRG